MSRFARVPADWAVVVLPLALAACASGPRPDFEQYFTAEYVGAEYAGAQSVSPSHARWMGLLATRYACDTVRLRYTTRSYTEYAVGLPPCDIASEIPPGVIRAWKTATGIREEWRMGSGAHKTTLYFEGATERALLVTFIQWW